MDVLEQLDIDLVNLKDGGLHREFTLGDDFFEAMDSPVLTKGNVDVQIDVHRVSGDYEVLIKCDGVAVVPCDRCLEDVAIDVHADERLIAKSGIGDADDEGIIYVDNPDGIVNVAWNIFETIALALPYKRVHPDGQCNESMVEKLERYVIDESGDSEAGSNRSEGNDPRWEGLKKLLNNNK